MFSGGDPGVLDEAAGFILGEIGENLIDEPQAPERRQVDLDKGMWQKALEEDLERGSNYISLPDGSNISAYSLEEQDDFWRGAVLTGLISKEIYYPYRKIADKYSSTGYVGPAAFEYEALDDVYWIGQYRTAYRPLPQ